MKRTWRQQLSDDDKVVDIGDGDVNGFGVIGDVDDDRFGNIDDDDDFYPIGHLMCICQTMVVVEDHDGGDHAWSHHEHDAIEIGAWQFKQWAISSNSSFEV